MGVGFTSQELERPIIGIANSWGEVNPAAVHLNRVAAAAKAGVRAAGGTPIEFVISSLCGGMSGGGKIQRYSFATRDIIVDYLEAVGKVQHFDAMVFIPVCDWVVPAHLIAAAKLNIPSVVVTGGYMRPVRFGGEEICAFDVLSKLGELKSGKISKEEFEVIEKTACSGSGGCPQMGTANTMAVIAESLGMTLPGNSSTVGSDNHLLRIAFNAGLQVLNLYKSNTKPSDIMTLQALQNAIKVYLAVGGSTNAIHQLLDLAGSLGLQLSLDTFDELSRITPTIANIKPTGEYNLKDLEEAGGLPAVMKELQHFLNLNVLTVTGQTLNKNILTAMVTRREVIFPISSPLHIIGGIAVLKGNLAPDGSIVKQVTVPKMMLECKGPAKVYDNEEDAIFALENNEIKSRDVVVIRYLGDKAEPGEIVRFLRLLRGMNLDKSIAAVTDGRLAGSDKGCAIAHVQPEAAEGGPISIVKNNDQIQIDITNRELNLLISDSELKSRLSNLN
jgi:dihydroxy-acid dehydratase